MYLHKVNYKYKQQNNNLSNLFKINIEDTITICRLNSLHPTINFLGVTVTKVDNKLGTDLYCKPTETHQYLHAQSCHRNVYKGSIERTGSKQWLVKRGYREDHLYSEIEIIKLVERTASFQVQDKTVDYSITLVLTYHPALNPLYEILRRAHKHILKSPRLYSALPHHQG